MSERVIKPATYADLEAVPPHLVAEILFGSLVTHPRPRPEHAAASVALGDELASPYQKGRGGPGGWIFLAEPELHLGPHVVVPDLAGWRAERLLGNVEKAWIEVIPDWVCEIISPGTERYDRGDKRRIYANFGLPHLWFVDPGARLLEVFRRQDRDWLLTHTFAIDDDEVCVPPFDAISFRLGLLWPFATPVSPAPDDEPR